MMRAFAQRILAAAPKGWLLAIAVLVLASPALMAQSNGPFITITCSPSQGPVEAEFAFSQECLANNSGPYFWTVTGLPAGLQAFADNSNRILIAGIPTDPGGYFYTIGVTGECPVSGEVVICSGQISFEGFLEAGPLTVVCDPSDSTIPLGSTYRLTCRATGGFSDYLWDYMDLPPWLSPGALTGRTVTLTGIPSPEGVFEFSIGVIAGEQEMASTTVIVRVGPRLTLSCTNGVGPAGTTVSATCVAGGGIAPYTYSSTNLPPGFELNASSGIIRGESATPGTFQISVRVTDSEPLTATRTVSITFTPPGVTLTCMELAVDAGTSVDAQPCAAAAGRTPYTFSATGLPAGLQIDASTGRLSGIATTPGTFQATVTVRDTSAPPVSTSATLAIQVNARQLSLSCSNVTGTVGSPLNATPCTTAGGTAPLTFQAAGLPAGLNLNASTGAVSGAPGSIGSFSVTITVLDSVTPPQSVSAAFTLTVNPQALSLSCTGFTIEVNTAASNTPCTASGGRTPYSFTATGLPNNLTMAAGSGAVSGTAVQTGTFNVTVTVTDSPAPGSSGGGQATAQMAIEVRFSLPPVRLGVSGADGPTAQPTVGVNLDQPAPAALTGTLRMTFTPANGNAPQGYIDPAAQFSNGSREVAFEVASGATAATFATPPQFSQGTVAGSFGFTVVQLQQGGTSVLPSPAPVTTHTLAASAPVITAGSVRIVNVTATGFSVQLQGFSNTRQLSSAGFQFSPASGGALDATTSFTVPLTEGAATWFASSNGLNNGSRFQLTIPFNYSGDPVAIGTVSATLTNAQGTSAAVSGGR